MLHEVAPYLPWIGSVLAVLCLIGIYRTGRRRRLIDNLPTSKTTGVFIGLVELKGTAEVASPLTSFLAKQECVHYRWTVQEHWSRTVVETYTDSNGRTQTRIRHESGWTTVADGGDMCPFYLKDDCGVVLVRPEGAQVEPADMFDETVGPGDPLYYGKGPAFAVPNSDFQRRFHEQGIPHHATLYVVGQARERNDIVAPEIAADPNAPIYLISTRSEEQVSSGMKWGERGWALAGLVLLVGGFVWRDIEFNIPWQPQLPHYALVALGYVFCALADWILMVYNSLVDVRQRVRQAWSLIDVQLQRRHDLIPNLVTTVRGYRDYEKQLQPELAALRSEMMATPPGVKGSDYNAVSKTAIAIAERYPDLKANENFLALQKTLSDTEQRIALARSYFNDIATHYNTRLEIIPECYVAMLGGMKPQTLMAANDFERAPVKIDMTSVASQ